MARLTVRVDFGKGGALGPGKIRLLEMIEAHGSIAAAGRALGMSYRRAWLLVDDLTRGFRKPIVARHLGGARGGGARLTPLGQSVVRQYRAIEARAASAVARHLQALQRARSARRLVESRRIVPRRRPPQRPRRK